MTEQNNQTQTGGHFSRTLKGLSAALPGDITLGDIIGQMGGSSIGSLLLFFALPMALPIPAPGLSMLFGVPLMLISLQLLFGRDELWLPKKLSERPISRDTLDAYVKRALPVMEKLERFCKPRLPAALGAPCLRLVGAMSLLLGFIITLPVPMGNVVPGAAISVMALGLIERDGAAILAGLGIGLASLGVIALALTGLAALGNAFM